MKYLIVFILSIIALIYTITVCFAAIINASSDLGEIDFQAIGIRLSKVGILGLTGVVCLSLVLIYKVGKDDG